MLQGCRTDNQLSFQILQLAEHPPELDHTVAITGVPAASQNKQILPVLSKVFKNTNGAFYFRLQKYLFTG